MTRAAWRRYAIVTGTSRGVGHAVAARLLGAGTAVLGISRGGATLDDSRYAHVRLDLSDTANVERWFEDVFAHEVAPSIDADEILLVNNGASIGRIDVLEHQTGRELQAAFALNAVTPAWLMGFVSRCFAGTPVTIVNLSSGAAQAAYAGWTTYCSTKAALLMSSRVFAREQLGTRHALPRSRRCVVCFAPGSVDTALQATIREGDLGTFADLAKFHDLQRNGALWSTVEVARVIGQIVDEARTAPFVHLRYVAHETLMCLDCGRTSAPGATEHACVRGETARLMSEERCAS